MIFGVFSTILSDCTLYMYSRYYLINIFYIRYYIDNAQYYPCFSQPDMRLEDQSTFSLSPFAGFYVLMF